MNPLQRCKDHSSLQFDRRRSNRFGENRLTDAYRAVFQKQAAPKSHAFFSCHEPLPPGMRSGELRGGLSSRPPGAESLKHRSQPRRVDLPNPNTARSTEFPLRRLAVRGCERTMSGAKRRASMKRSGTSEADFRTAVTKKANRQLGSRGGSYCRRLSSARGRMATDCKSAETQIRIANPDEQNTEASRGEPSSRGFSGRCGCG